MNILVLTVSPPIEKLESRQKKSICMTIGYWPNSSKILKNTITGIPPWVEACIPVQLKYQIHLLLWQFGILLDHVLRIKAFLHPPKIQRI